MTESMSSIAAHCPLCAPLAEQTFPALSEAYTDPLVLLHGWGFDSRSWQALLPTLQAYRSITTLDLPGFGNSAAADFSLDAVLEAIVDRLPPRAVLMGWSLGGMLAVALSARYPERVSRVITIASNVRFVADTEWPHAMPSAVNQRFNRDFRRTPEQTLKRFGALVAHGDVHARALRTDLAHLAPAADRAVSGDWGQALDLLADLDNRVAFRDLKQPGLHLFGEHDALVPAEAAPQLSALNPRQQVVVVGGAGHAPHLSQPTNVADAVLDFLGRTQEQRDKRRVADSFSRAAPAYDSVARLQRRVGEGLIDRFADVELPLDARIVDLGCGTGYFTEALHVKRPEATLLGLDIAEGMVRFARQQRSAPVHWLCGDAEQLPLASASIDLAFSSLAVQWCEQLPALFQELHRILRPGGRLLVATLGPQTLWELKAAWRSVDGYEHVNRFPAREEVDGELCRAGFTSRQWQTEEQVLRYQTLHELTRELKVLGARNVNRGQAEGLTGRRKLRALQSAYEHHRREGALPATYEVMYLSATRSAAR